MHAAFVCADVIVFLGSFVNVIGDDLVLLNTVYKGSAKSNYKSTTFAWYFQQTPDVSENTHPYFKCDIARAGAQHAKL